MSVHTFQYSTVHIVCKKFSATIHLAAGFQLLYLSGKLPCKNIQRSFQRKFLQWDVKTLFAPLLPSPPLPPKSVKKKLEMGEMRPMKRPSSSGLFLYHQAPTVDSILTHFCITVCSTIRLLLLLIF